ncbi:MAG: 50S ribosomal protein L24 [Thaumarchaeota archaeon]|nr:50S ribosomal protein L24 [Nitrososphaerota archaeon]
MKFDSKSSKPTKMRKSAALSSVRDRSLKLSRAALSSDLKSKYGTNSIRLRTGDSVKLVRGEYAGIEGKIQKVFPKEGRITVEGVTREKIAGGTTPLRIHASNVVVTSVNLEDKLRRQKLEGST